MSVFPPGPVAVRLRRRLSPGCSRRSPMGILPPAWRECPADRIFVPTPAGCCGRVPSADPLRLSATCRSFYHCIPSCKPIQATPSYSGVSHSPDRSLVVPAPTGQRTVTELGISPSTVSHTFHRLGLSRIKDIEPLPPPRRYECSRSGEMIHIDIKKLAHIKAPGHQITRWHTGMHRSSGAGWEYLTRLHRRLFPRDFFRCEPDKTARSAVAFLQAVVATVRMSGLPLNAS